MGPYLGSISTSSSCGGRVHLLRLEGHVRRVIQLLMSRNEEDFGTVGLGLGLLPFPIAL